MYADDTKLFLQVETSSDQARLQSVLESFTSNWLELSIEKCTTITFSSSRSSLLTNYTLGGCILERKDCVCDLGVFLDGKLNFDKQNMLYLKPIS